MNPKIQPANKIQAALDVAGIDWRSPMSNYENLGASDASEDQDYHLLRVDDHGLFGALHDGLFAECHYNINLKYPPVRFVGTNKEGIFSFFFPFLSATATIKRRLIPLLGLPETYHYRMISVDLWQDQAGSIRITTSYHADGTRRTDVEIIPGWRHPLDDEDKAALRDMMVVGRGSKRGHRSILSAYSCEEEAKYVKDPQISLSNLDGIIGVCEKTARLVACPGKLLILPLDKIKRFEILESEAGGSEIRAVIGREKVIIAEHDEPNALGLVGRSLARMTRCKVQSKAC